MGTLSYTPTKSKYSDVRKVEYCQYVESLLLKKKNHYARIFLHLGFLHL